MKFRVKDSRIILLLVFALLGQIILLLWHLDIFSFAKNNKENTLEKAAGEILKIENQLKRRPLESLIWQDSSATEKVFYFDSVLTLKESTAQIKLENGTQISLSENTLITIEPPEKENPGEIRILFVQGSLKSRNPYKVTKIKNEKTYLQIKENSDVEIFKSNKDSLSVHVSKGAVTLTRDKNQINLGANQIYREEKGRVLKFTNDKSLVWQIIPPKRIYTHGKKEKVKLKWQGMAEKIQVSTQGKEGEKIALLSDQDTLDLELSLGQHRIQLESKGSVSDTLLLQVWEAPLLHLISPQPRNRQRLGSTEFIWTSHEKIKKFHLKLVGKNYNKSIISNANSLSVDMKLEDDLKWDVWGEDQEGFLVPPLYNYDLYIRENPFAPPKLNRPKLLEEKKDPKQTLNLWQSLLISKAWAKKYFDTFFSWQKIEGAHYYFIEISESIDFRSLSLQEKIEATEFVWTQYEKEKKYYWRVAAGGKDGRMGLFSEPTEVLVEQIIGSKPKEKKILKKEIKVEPVANKIKNGPKMLPPESIRTLKDKEVFNDKFTVSRDKIDIKNGSGSKDLKAESKEDEAAKQEKRKKDFNSKNMIWLRPGYTVKSIKEDSITQADLNGIMFFGIGFEKNFLWGKESLLDVSFKYSQASYEPKPKIEFPFQQEILLINSSLSFNWKSEKSKWAFGGTLQYLPQVKRESFEELKENQKVVVGPQVIYSSNWDFYNYKAEIAALCSDTLYGLKTSHQFLVFPFERKIFFGFEIELQYLLGTDKSTQVYDSFINLGYQF